MKRSHLSLLSVAVLGLSVHVAVPVGAQTAPVTSLVGETVAQHNIRMQWWREARFGMFIHWDPISIKGTEISWSRDPNPAGPNPGGIPAAQYDALYKQFDPVKFDAKAVVALAKAAGMKYIVFTTKHHDGFAMFDSKLTDYKITGAQSPYGKDIARQLADACHEAGLHWCVYYSQPDLHHPDYKVNQAQYDRYFHAQVHELQTEYGQVDSVWFDGLGGSATQWDADNLFRQMHADNPNIIINNRCGLPGDYYTPEQSIGTYDDQRDWETCMTIGDQWAYAPHDRYKSAAQCIQTLARCNGGDGNFLLNIGLQRDGAVDPTQADRLKGLAAWMNTRSEAIYGTRGGPFKPATHYVSTRKGNTVYVHVLKWDGDTVQLPALPKRIVRSWVVGDTTKAKVKVKQTADALIIRLPVAAQNSADTVVALQLNSSALSIAPISAATLKVAPTASTVYGNDPTYGADKAFDGDAGTRWATPDGTKTASIEAELLSPTTIAGVTINEAYAGRVQKFQLQYQAPNSTQWLTLIEGTQLGAIYHSKFAPVKAKAVRLNILDATEGPTISEISFDKGDIESQPIKWP